MEQAALIFFGLIIVAIVNLLGFRQVVKTLLETRGKS